MPARLAILLGTVVSLSIPASASAITGGQPATRGYPYMVALTDSEGEWRDCGASLVRADWVLTAAHCVEDEKAEALGVRLGTADISSRANGEQIGVSRVIVHERWGDADSASGLSYDVALLKLDRASTRGMPIRIPAPSEQAIWAEGRIATVTGWGGTFYPGIGGVNTTEEELREVQVPMVSDERCASYAYGQGDVSDFTVGEFDPETMVCAGNDEGGADSCNGDSGGPLVVPDASGALVQVGVVSWGFGCAYPFSYGVYSRIADDPLFTWIQRQLPAQSTTTTTSTDSRTPAAPPTPGTPPSHVQAPSGAGAPAEQGGTTSSRSSRTRVSAARRAAARRRAVNRSYRRCVSKAKKIKSTSRRRRAMKRCASRRRAASRRAAAG